MAGLSDEPAHFRDGCGQALENRLANQEMSNIQFPYFRNCRYRADIRIRKPMASMAFEPQPGGHRSRAPKPVELPRAALRI